MHSVDPRDVPNTWGDGERVFVRARRSDHDGDTVIIARLATERPRRASYDRFFHEFSLRDELDSAWAVRPLELMHEGDHTLLLLEDPGGEPLEHLLGTPLDVERFLRLAAGIVAALGKFHERGLVHKDVKPANILVSCADGQPRLTGFGITSRLTRHRQAPDPPETIAGTLAYMAPEQTGRMNRSIDGRSDLYALGVTFYRMLTGMLPFTAADAMEWVHCHVARRPVPPSQRLSDLPAVVSAIVMKLLAKTAEERYQTASGVEHDLRCSLRQWEELGRIDPFPLGERDMPDRLLIPETLYGREGEVDNLLAAFERVVQSGTPELVLVSGYSGIGKSSVVNELHKALVPPRGLFASGKFDQHKRDVPYSTLAQAFQSLVRPLLGKSDAELVGPRDALLEALGPNARLIIEVVPELKHIIGEQPPVPELPPQDAQRRFQSVLHRFIGIFARPEHPLALFLDDLQWLDAATMGLLEDLLTRADLRHLMLIGAYRDNEVSATHPLRRKIETIRAAGGKVTEIAIGALERSHLGALIADALRCEPDRAALLAQAVHGKTGGNPFFAIQFLYALAEEGLLAFDHGARRWSWDVERILAKPYTDNVGRLMVSKLSRLPTETRKAVQLLACLGNAADLATTSIAFDAPEEQVYSMLWPAIRQELVERLPGAYRFAHDRVQEAAYSLIPLERQAELHLQLGRLLEAHTPSAGREAVIFDIVNQLNRGAAFIASQGERERLAALNLLAGERAKSSAAYASALTYLAAGAALLSEDTWERLHELRFTLELRLAECEYATGALAQAEARLAALSTRAGAPVQLATVACLRIDLHMTIGELDRAVAVALDTLRHFGIDWPSDPTEEQVRSEYERIWSQLGGRTIEELRELPLMTNPDTLATVEILMRLGGPTYVMGSRLFSLVSCKAINLGLEHGHSEASCVAYEYFAMTAGPTFGEYEAGFRFACLGNELAEKPELDRFKARTIQTFGFVSSWTRHVRTGRDLLLRGIEIANRTGDHAFAAYAYGQLNTNLLLAGDPLDETQREAEKGLEFAEKLGFGIVAGWITGQLGLIRTLRGLTTRFGTFDDGRLKEREFERQLSSQPALALVECWYWIRKLQACFLAGDYTAAVNASSRAQPLLQASMSMLETAEYHFYSALTHAACWDTETGEARQRHNEALAAHYQQLRIWAENCQDNFENRAALVGAETARIEDRALDAMDLYERAIRSARTHGFVHNEALGNEFAARFYAARGFETIALAYLRNARDGYSRWGADGKVRQLDQLYPQIRVDPYVAAPTGTIGTPVEQLDLVTVIKVSQAVSGEIVLDKLIDTLMRTAMAQAGAERVLLVLSQSVGERIIARATIDGDTMRVELCDEATATIALPESIVHYVLRSRESVILDDASAEGEFAADPYVRQHRVRSAVGLPMLTQAKLVGMLYLENNLAPRVFAPARIAVLKLLASQAATALENTRLYRDLAVREAKIRRLVDANIIGIVFWKADGAVLEANDAFLDMLGYERDDLVSGNLRWTDLTPSEWKEADERALDQILRTGRAQPFKKEYVRRDGQRLPVLVGATAIETDGKEGIAFVLDLTERTRAEEQARESDRRYREVQSELAHANRIATMGHLSASIAHEVNQPITGAITYADAALRWLRAQPPNLEEVDRALGLILESNIRAGEVVSRIRALVKKVPPRKDRFDINEVIQDVIALSRREMEKSDVSVEIELAEDPPSIQGDRVQLTQVTLNLVINAIDAIGETREPGKMAISTAWSGTDALVTVRDSGNGLRAEFAEKLFKPFYTTKTNGMGMGLSISRAIIEAHRGRLWASTNAPQGAVFQFTVPALRSGSNSAGSEM